MRVLGLETSCDDTGVGIYDAEHGLLAHALHSQIAAHAPFGGVVPELASRDHLQRLLPLIETVLAQAKLSQHDLSGVAYTSGPGLAGALLTGAMLGRTLAFAWGIPALGVHHLEGHLLAAFLEPHPPTFPFLALLVSGGHTELIQVENLGRYHLLGATLDDAAGEAFDKTAKLLGLGYPGGAKLAKLATQGRRGRFHFPRPMTDRPGLEFSFSGLKTYAVNTAATHSLDEQTKADIAYAFEDAIVETLVIKCKRALKITQSQRLVLAGGVAANTALRAALKNLCDTHNIALYVPRPAFCTDNGAMIAYAGCQHLLAGESDDLQVTIKPRWAIER